MAQTPAELDHIDTLVTYDATFSIMRQGWPVVKTYSVNGKKASEEEYRRVAVPQSRSEKCNPCYLVVKDLEERKVREGLFYGLCPGEKAPKMPDDSVYTGDKRYIIQIPSCYEGEWIYYDTTGKVIEKKRFEKGKQVQPPVPGSNLR